MVTPLTGRLERYLDLLSQRQQITATNIANADTPDYRTQDVDFATALRTLEDRQPGAVASRIEVKGLPLQNDGNNVSIDREARMLSETALRFSLAQQLVRSELRAVQIATREGRS